MIDQNYARSLSAKCAKNGWTAAVINWRGFATPLRSPRVFSVGDTRDAEVAIQIIRARFPAALLFGVGFSAGSNILVKLLGGPIGEQFASAISVCNGFEYKENLDRVEATAVGRLYSRILALRLKWSLVRHYDVFENVEGLDWGQLFKSSLLSEYEATIATAVYGYRSADDMFRETGCAPAICRVMTPLLCVQSSDDPLFLSRVRDMVPIERLRENPHVMYLEVPYGGHLSFVQGWFSIEDETYLDKIAGVWISHAVERVKGVEL